MRGAHTVRTLSTQARPDDLLAVYCFCKALPAGDEPGCTPPGYAHAQLFSTVSHFNLIHMSCHVAAKAADAALRTPKREWEGAVLRNGEVLCNNLLPLRGPRVPETAYIDAVLVHWEGLLAVSGVGLRKQSSLRAADTTPLRLSLVRVALLQSCMFCRLLMGLMLFNHACSWRAQQYVGACLIATAM